MGFTELILSFKSDQEMFSIGTNMLASVEIKSRWGLMLGTAAGASGMGFFRNILHVLRLRVRNSKGGLS